MLLKLDRPIADVIGGNSKALEMTARGRTETTNFSANPNQIALCAA
jgi:hypothetical protein